MRRIATITVYATVLATQLPALDFVFSGGGSVSTIGDPKIGLAISISDYQSRYRSGLWLGWSVGITTLGAGDPEKYYHDGVIVTTPGDIKDSMFWGEARLLYRWREHDELWVSGGGAWNHVTNHDYGYGITGGLGYQHLFDSYVFAGGSLKTYGLKFHSGQEDTEHLDGDLYNVTSINAFVGFRF